ncbi:hypothetical protein SASPL_155526 (mitochondrion) [Salvia splendens]|uniref:Uncharacterized protein n=1 Tax=Salvia splendens TaxID=180675 RepID=A0A8X8YXA9_SALSN|nr:hypothetical protein SASPL_156333 [Salvia splendens]KAG6384672.1 hypothetical protein SASPL_155526 [Salvia splendens]
MAGAILASSLHYFYAVEDYHASLMKNWLALATLRSKLKIPKSHSPRQQMSRVKVKKAQARARRPAGSVQIQSPSKPGCPITLTGAFRDNISRFLQECAGLEDYDLEGMPIWRTFLVYESKGTVLPLYTVEENVEHSDRPFCDYCRCVVEDMSKKQKMDLRLLYGVAYGHSWFVVNGGIDSAMVALV